jgi:hypothetical protein
MSGDFVVAAFHVMPHANEPERCQRIVDQMKRVKALTLAEHSGGKVKPIEDVKFPPYGRTDADVFGNNLLEVMQFVFNHVNFDPDDKMDQAVLAAYKPLGIEPGKAYDPETVAKTDGARFRKMAEQIQAEKLGLLAKVDIFTRRYSAVLCTRKQFRALG